MRAAREATLMPNGARRTLACLLLAGVCAAGLSGCANVSRLERSYLSDPMMIFDADPIESVVHQLIRDSREASKGGYGVSGGGCACSQ